MQAPARRNDHHCRRAGFFCRRPGNRTNASRTPMHGTHDQGPPLFGAWRRAGSEYCYWHGSDCQSRAVKTAAARIRGPLVFAWQRAIRDADTNVLSRSAKLVAFVMATFANPDGRSCRPGVERIRQATGLSRRTIERARAELTRAGFIACVTPGSSPGRNGGAGRAAEWQLRLPGNEPPAAAAQSRMSRRPEQIDPPRRLK